MLPRTAQRGNNRSQHLDHPVAIMYMCRNYAKATANEPWSTVSASASSAFERESGCSGWRWRGEDDDILHDRRDHSSRFGDDPGGQAGHYPRSRPPAPPCTGSGYLPQEASVFRKLSVRDNIAAILETRAGLDEVQRRAFAGIAAGFQLGTRGGTAGQRAFPAANGGARKSPAVWQRIRNLFAGRTLCRRGSIA